MIFCQLDCSFYRNLTLFDENIWSCREKAVILHRFSMTPALKVREIRGTPTHRCERKTRY